MVRRLLTLHACEALSLDLVKGAFTNHGHRRIDDTLSGLFRHLAEHNLASGSYNAGYIAADGWAEDDVRAAVSTWAKQHMTNKGGVVVSYG